MTDITKARATDARIFFFFNYFETWELNVSSSHQFRLLRIDRFAELQKGLELVVLGERDDLHDGAKLGKNLGTKKKKELRSESGTQETPANSFVRSTIPTCWSTSSVTG